MPLRPIVESDKEKEEAVMVSATYVDEQLKRLGVRPTFFTRPEIRELKHILLPDEQIQHFVSGRYDGGYAILCATDMRILLIDKKPFYLTPLNLTFNIHLTSR